MRCRGACALGQRNQPQTQHHGGQERNHRGTNAGVIHRVAPAWRITRICTGGRLAKEAMPNTMEAITKAQT